MEFVPDRVKELHDRLQRIFGYGATIKGVAIEDMEVRDGRLFATMADGTETEIVQPN